MFANRFLFILTVFFVLQSGAAWAQGHRPNKLTSAQAKVGDDAVVRTLVTAATGFDISHLRGKAVLVVNWSTDCVVCLDYMNELRRNLEGWKGKPFVIVALNRDKDRQDYLTYSKFAETILGENPQCINVFHQDLAVDNLFRQGKLPLNFVIDPKGIVRQIHEGRVPIQSWDDIAELIP